MSLDEQLRNSLLIVHFGGPLEAVPDVDIIVLDYQSNQCVRQRKLSRFAYK